MEPHVQYVTTADGVSIAFATRGEGVTFVHMPPIPLRHFQIEWQLPQERRWLERIRRGRKLVQYDPRGMGLSERRVQTFSLDSLVLDLEAVADRVGAEQLVLFAGVTSGPIAVAYAARHPERVSHLILWCAAARIADGLPPQVDTLLQIIGKDWDLFTEAVAHVLLGWSAGETARQYAAWMRECVTPEVLQAFIHELLHEVDVTPLLPQVRSPTLILHRRQVPSLNVDLARNLASRIPEARLTILEGAMIPLAMGNMDAAARTIDEFLGDGAGIDLPAGSSSDDTARLVTILFTDVEGSTSLTQRLGDAEARELLRSHERIVREALHAHGGKEVKTLGDGFLASFGSATHALESAIAMQEAFARLAKRDPQRAIRVRIGINAGEPVMDEGDLFGAAVNLAARIAAHAEPGCILVSDVVRQLVAGKRFSFREREAARLPGFAELVRLYELPWNTSG